MKASLQDGPRAEGQALELPGGIFEATASAPQRLYVGKLILPVHLSGR